MEKVQVFLTAAQKRNFEQGKSFQLSRQQLEATTGKHHVEIEISHQHYKKLLQNVKHNKGFRFTPQIVKGGSILSSLKKAAKSVGKFVVHNVPKDTLKAGLSSLAMAGSTAIGQPQLGALASYGINKAVDAGYGHKDKSVSVRDHAMNTARDIGLYYGDQYAQYNHPQAYSVAKQIHRDYNGYGGQGIKKNGGKLRKGSPEMVEKMARLRAMRGKKGGSVLGDLKKAFDPKKNGVAKTFNSVKSTVAPYIRPAITQGLAAGIDAVTGTPLGTIATPGIQSGVNAALDKANIGIGIRGRGNRTHTLYGGLVNGIPSPILTQRAMDTINTMGLTHHKYTPNGLPTVGGSFLSL
jgi:hypothetical protein